MSNPEKEIVVTEEEISDESEYSLSDDDAEYRELVLALPALSVSERMAISESIRDKAVVAAQLVIAAAEEGAAVGSVEDGKKKKKVRPRKAKEDGSGASGSTVAVEGEDEPAKKKKGSSILRNPPDGPPTCNVCGRLFDSWKGVFGHLRAHKDRGYVGFLPPPTFNAADERFGRGVVTANASGGGFGLCPGGLRFDLNDIPKDDEDVGFDLNVPPVEEAEEEAAPAPPAMMIDLDRSPPQDDGDNGADNA